MDAKPRRQKLIALLGALVLGALALSQIAFGLLHAEDARLAAASTAAAPYPKVFCDKDGYEAFAHDFELSGTDSTGGRHLVVMTPEVYERIRGPYNRRNVYGAALSFAPRISREQLDSVVRYAFVSDGGLRAELGLPPDLVELTVRITPKQNGETFVFHYDLRGSHA